MSSSLSPNVSFVLKEIMNDIETGQMEPGQWINTAQISAKLGMSCESVREALSILYGSGLIDFNQDGRACVRVVRVLDLKNISQIYISVSEIGLRMVTEKSLTTSEVQEIKTAMNNIENASNQSEFLNFVQQIHALHYEINRISQNVELNRMMERLHLRYYVQYLVALIDFSNAIHHYVKTYKLIVDSIIAGDMPSVVSIFHFHHDWILAKIQQGFTARGFSMNDEVTLGILDKGRSL